MTVVDGYRLVSNSEIQAFKRCRRKWWLAWLRGLTPAHTNPASVASSGTRNHQALAMYYTPGYVGSVHPVIAHERVAADELRSYDMSRHATPEGRSELLRMFLLESVMLAGYMQWLADTGADADLEVIASEMFMAHEIYPGVKLIGKLDARVRDIVTGRRWFLDHKNVQAFVNPQTLRANEQFLHYELLESLSGAEERCDGGIYNQLKRSKRTTRAQPPFFQRETVTHNSHDLSSYRQRVTGIIDEMQRAEDKFSSGVPHHGVMYPSPNASCAWDCPFARVCSLFDDGSRVEDALQDLFVSGNPLDYYGGSEREVES